LIGVAAGDFCGGTRARPEKQLVVLANREILDPFPTTTTIFSLLEGPTPHFTAEINSFGPSNSFMPWTAVAAGKLDPNNPHDLIVAARSVSQAHEQDLFIVGVSSVGGGLTPSQCGTSNVVASTSVDGSSSRSTWLGAAVGNFDGTGKKRIVMMRAER